MYPGAVKGKRNRWSRRGREGSKRDCNEVPKRDKVEAGNKGKRSKGKEAERKAAEVREMGTNRREWGSTSK